MNNNVIKRLGTSALACIVAASTILTATPVFAYEITENKDEETGEILNYTVTFDENDEAEKNQPYESLGDQVGGEEYIRSNSAINFHEKVDFVEGDSGILVGYYTNDGSKNSIVVKNQYIADGGEYRINSGYNVQATYYLPKLDTGYIYSYDYDPVAKTVTFKKVTVPKEETTSCEESTTSCEESEPEVETSSESTYQPSAAEVAQVTRELEGVVGTEAYTKQQRNVQETVSAVVNALATIPDTQRAEIEKVGMAFDVGGCTSLNGLTVAALLGNPNKISLIANSKESAVFKAKTPMPYNILYTWKGMKISIVVPKGAVLYDCMDESGNLLFYKLAAKYGYKATLL